MKSPKSKTVPEDFKLEIGHRVWASQNVPGVDIDFETGAFKDHEFSHARSNWTATWRNWMREAYRRKARYQPAPKAVIEQKDQADILALHTRRQHPNLVKYIGTFRDINPGETVSQYRLAQNSAIDEARSQRPLRIVR